MTLLRLSLLTCALALAACGSDPGNTDNNNTNVDAGTSALGTVEKGGACTQDSDCKEMDAKCRAGDVCTGALTEAAFQEECAAGGSADCAGLTCVGLRDNVQSKTGICSMRCEEDADCGAGAACVTISGTNKGCLHLCATDADCLNGFACVADPEGRGKACFVEPV